jgi:hypothetical protein
MLPVLLFSGPIPWRKNPPCPIPKHHWIVSRHQYMSNTCFLFVWQMGLMGWGLRHTPANKRRLIRGRTQWDRAPKMRTIADRIVRPFCLMNETIAANPVVGSDSTYPFSWWTKWLKRRLRSPTSQNRLTPFLTKLQNRRNKGKICLETTPTKNTLRNIS